MSNGSDVLRELGLDAGDPVLSGGDTLVNSGQFSGMSRGEGREAMLRFARENRLGGHVSSSRLKDWLISRQR